jgi:long-subunit fatty acid transport protein
MKKIIMLVILMLAAGGLFAADNGVAAAFVDPGSARASSLGGAYTAVADDANSVFYNPAGIVNSEYKDVTFMYMKQKWIVPYNYAAIIYPFNRYWGMGFGMIISGDQTLMEQTYLLSFAGSLDWFQKVIRGISVGVNLKLNLASYGNNPDTDPDKVIGNAGGCGMDFGIMWKVTDNIQAGLMLKDAFSYIKWQTNFGGNYNEGVPLTSGLGLAYKMKELLASAELSDLDMVRFGLEKTLWTYVDVRVGYTQTLDIESSKQYMIGLGVGHFEFGARREFSFNIDSSFAFERLDNTLKIQTSFKFK